MKKFWSSLWEHSVGPRDRCVPERNFEIGHPGRARACEKPGCGARANTMNILTEKGAVCLLVSLMIFGGLLLVMWLSP